MFHVEQAASSTYLHDGCGPFDIAVRRHHDIHSTVSPHRLGPHGDLGRRRLSLEGQQHASRSDQGKAPRGKFPEVSHRACGHDIEDLIDLGGPGANDPNIGQPELVDHFDQEGGPPDWAAIFVALVSFLLYAASLGAFGIIYRTAEQTAMLMSFVTIIWVAFVPYILRRKEAAT